MAKICMISINHSPLDDRIFYKEALSLKNAGHELFMICRADENGIMFDMGNNIALNKRGEKEVEFKGVRTFPIPSTNDFLSNTLNKVFKGPFFSEFIEKAVSLNADVYHAHEPVSFYIGLQIAKRIKTKVIFDSHESYTTGTPKEIWIKNRYIRDLKYLIAANHLTRGYLVSANPAIKSTVIYNAAENAHYETNSIAPSKKVIIAHDGYLPFNRGLKEMLHAFAIAHNKHPEIEFKIIGETKGEEREFLTRFIATHHLENVVYETGWVDYQNVAEELQNCSIGLITKQPTVNNVLGGPPIKYYNYTAAGMAIIDVNMPETTRLLAKYKNGITVSDRSAQGISKAIIHLVEHPELLKTYQSNSSQAFTHLNWNTEGQKLVEFYENQVLNDTVLTCH